MPPHSCLAEVGAQRLHFARREKLLCRGAQPRLPTNPLAGSDPRDRHQEPVGKRRRRYGVGGPVGGGTVFPGSGTGPQRLVRVSQVQGQERSVSTEQWSSLRAGQLVCVSMGSRKECQVASWLLTGERPAIEDLPAVPLCKRESAMSCLLSQHSGKVAAPAPLRGDTRSPWHCPLTEPTSCAAERVVTLEQLLPAPA